MGDIDLKFPDKFFWGTTTSSHQIEGNNFYNDWWEWENSSERIKKLKEQGENPKNFISGRACDYYHLYEKDFDLIKSLNNNAYRFSIEWSRVEPKEKRFDEREIEHYRKMIKALLQRGVEPFVTLWHFTNPVWFVRKGGWERKKNIKYFLDYVDKITKGLGRLATFWITLNEPNIFSENSYLFGKFPPQKRSFFLSHRVFFNLEAAHKKAYSIIHRNAPRAKVGVANYLIYYTPLRLSSFLDRFIVRIMSRARGRHFLTDTINYQDFIGINYYHHNRITLSLKQPKFLRIQNENLWTSDMGWEICPEGIYHILRDIQRYKKPIYITENGIADAEDKNRTKFIMEHLKWIHKAIQEEVDVRGYFYWSLLDNFEWAEGFGPRFGLFEVNYKNMERIPRKSAENYSIICKNNKTPKQFL